MMALAIHCDALINEGKVADQAALARLGHVSRSRITQLLNLLNLAPDIQEAILFLPRTLRGKDLITERDLRPIAATLYWNKQRAMWNPMPNACRSKASTDRQKPLSGCPAAPPTRQRRSTRPVPA